MTISNEAKEAAAELYNDGWPDTLTVSHVIQLAIDRTVAKALNLCDGTGACEGNCLKCQITNLQLELSQEKEKCKPLVDTLIEFHYEAERHSQCYPENKCAACLVLANHTKQEREKK